MQDDLLAEQRASELKQMNADLEKGDAPSNGEKKISTVSHAIFATLNPIRPDRGPAGPRTRLM